MKLEDQVCALEYSKRLDELGVKQDSYFQWFKLKDKDEWSLAETWQIDDAERFDTLPAYTAAELGDMLPNGVVTRTGAPFDGFRLVIGRFCSVDEQGNITRNYTVNYECDSTATEGIDAWVKRQLTNNMYDPNLANALAKMRIFLLENKLIEFPV